ncbi:hypothetical protein ACE1OC_40020 [Streptomyces sp. DSM 116496]|uniref:hypothetical protein n=1 Tax=Streptomyces stoeckheimensis TaxID=3344656 RepID=UPI0038B35E06
MTGRSTAGKSASVRAGQQPLGQGAPEGQAADPADTEGPVAPQLPPDLAAQELPGRPGGPSDLDRRLASARDARATRCAR